MRCAGAMRFLLRLVVSSMVLCLPLRSAFAAEILTAAELLQQADSAWGKGNRAEAVAMCTQAIIGDPKNLPHRAQIAVGPETLSLLVTARSDASGRYAKAMIRSLAPAVPCQSSPPRV